MMRERGIIALEGMAMHRCCKTVDDLDLFCYESLTASFDFLERHKKEESAVGWLSPKQNMGFHPLLASSSTHCNFETPLDRLTHVLKRVST
jgi:hypothetical protein